MKSQKHSGLRFKPGQEVYMVNHADNYTVNLCTIDAIVFRVGEPQIKYRCKTGYGKESDTVDPSILFETREEAIDASVELHKCRISTMLSLTDVFKRARGKL